MSPSNFQLVQFIKDVYLDSQVTIGLLSNVTAFSATPVGQRGDPNVENRPPRNYREAEAAETITAAQTAAARDFVNEISGSRRMMCHGMLYTGRGNLEWIQQQIDENHPDSWKGYNISNAAKVDEDPNSLMRRWRHDDEDVAYPTFELIQNVYNRIRDEYPGFNNICVHKGLAPGPPDPVLGHPADLPKAAQDWPGLKFVTYHSCIQQTMWHADSLQTIRSRTLRDGVPDIKWTTEYAQLVAPYSNCIAEIGTTWASSIVTFPTVAAHIMGQLMRYMGEDRIVFGSDCVWYGSPQWQIDALWRFQIPRTDARGVWLSGADRHGEAQDPGAQLGGAVRHRAGRGRREGPHLPTGARGLRGPDLRRVEDDHGVPGLHRGQHVEAQEQVRGARPRAGTYPLRLDPDEGVAATRADAMPAEWSAIGAGLFCPVAVSPAPGRVVLLARTAAGELVRRERLPDGGWARTPIAGRPDRPQRGRRHGRAGRLAARGLRLRR